MGQASATSIGCPTCCARGDGDDGCYFHSEADLDAHAFSVHWCRECADALLQQNPFPDFLGYQTHVLTDCKFSTSRLAGRTRGLSIYDVSDSSANIRRQYMPDTFEGHHIVGLASEGINNEVSSSRLTFGGGGGSANAPPAAPAAPAAAAAAAAALAAATGGDASSTAVPLPSDSLFRQEEVLEHHYYFDMAVPGRSEFHEAEVNGVAVTCCFEAALQLLRGRPVNSELCDELVQTALMVDGAERSRSIATIFMRERYREELEILIDTELPLVAHVDQEDAPMIRRRVSRRVHERVPTKLPPDWESSLDDEGNKVYSNRSNGQDAWSPPKGSVPARTKITSFHLPSPAGSFHLPTGASMEPVSSAAGSAASTSSGSPSRASVSSSSDLRLSGRTLSVDSAASSAPSTAPQVEVFDMSAILKLQKYSQESPLVAILTRSPNTALVLSFDVHGHATMFLPYCDSAKNCVFFGFKKDPADDHHLACQLFEEFPPMSSEEATFNIRKHWNSFRMTVSRAKRGSTTATATSAAAAAAASTSAEVRQSDLRPRLSSMAGLSDLSQSGMLMLTRRESTAVFSAEDLAVRFSQLRHSQLGLGPGLRSPRAARAQPILSSSRDARNHAPAAAPALRRNLSQVMEVSSSLEDRSEAAYSYTTDRDLHSDGSALVRSSSLSSDARLTNTRGGMSTRSDSVETVDQQRMSQLEEENTQLRREVQRLRADNAFLTLENETLLQSLGRRS